MAKSYQDKRTYDFKEGVCIYCNKKDEEDVDCGKLLTDQDGKISVHNYCLLFASGLSQSGDDSDGINGFLLPDILAEYRRAKRLRCVYCTHPRATIGCSVQSCRKGYHFNCGFKKEAVFLFFDTFLSYCVDHRPKQVAPTKPCSQSSVMCPICMDEVEAKVSNHTLRTPCCNNTWFHRSCVQRQALSAGYFFRCAICNNQKEFQEEMKQFGIYIPEHDASWEQEDNAYQELYWRHDNCDIDPCKCPEGRKYNEVSSKWELVLCDLCGSYGCHLACGGLRNVNQDWACALCSAMLSTATEVNCPSTKSSQVPASPGVDSPTKIGNSTRTAMKLMGKHPRTPLSAHGMRKKSTTTSSQLTQGSTPDSQFGSLDHCRPSTSKEGLEETGSPPKRKRKLSFNSKENALRETDSNSHDMDLKKHCSWKTQSLDFWCDHNKAGVKTSSALQYGRRTTLRMSMRPRNFSQQSKSCSVPSKSRTAESPAKMAKKKAINTSGSKTKKRSSLVSSKIEAYFSAVPRKMDIGPPVISVKKEKGIASQGYSEPVRLNKKKIKVKKERQAQVQDKSHFAIAESRKCLGKSLKRKATLIKKIERSSSLGNTPKDTSEEGYADNLARSRKSYPEGCDQNMAVVKEEHKDESAETPPSEQPASPMEQEVFFKNMNGCLKDSDSFMLNWGKKDSDNDDVVTPSTSGESLESADTSGENDIPDLLAESKRAEHGEEGAVRAHCNSDPRDSFQGLAPPDRSTPAKPKARQGTDHVQAVRAQCNSDPRDSLQGLAPPDRSTPAKPKALQVTDHVQAGDVGKVKEIQHLSRKSDIHQDISENPSAVFLQNESAGDATPSCNLREGEQSSASQHEESLTSQALSKESPVLKADCNESTPGSAVRNQGNPKRKPSKISKKMRLQKMYPAIGGFMKKYHIIPSSQNNKAKRRSKKYNRLHQTNPNKKYSHSQPEKKAARVSADIKSVNQVRVTSGGMLLRRLHSKWSYTPNSTVHTGDVLGENKTGPGEEPSVSSHSVKSTKPPVEDKDGTKKASSIEVDSAGSSKGQLSSLPRREKIDYLKSGSYLAADISPTLAFESSEETLSRPDTVRQAGGACLRMHEGKKKQQDICDKSFEMDKTTASQSDGVPSPIPPALISEDAKEISVQPDATSYKEKTPDGAESLEEVMISSEHWSPTSKQPNQDPIIPSVVTDDKTAQSVDGAVCELPGNKNALGLEIGRPPSAESILLSETSPDSGISQSYSCNIDELTVEKPSPMTVNDNSFPPWLPRESPSSDVCTCKSRKNDIVDDQCQNDVDTSGESEVVFTGSTNCINIVQDELIEKTNDEYGEDVPPSGSKNGMTTNDTSRSSEKRNGNCPETASSNLTYVTWSSYLRSSQDAEVSLSASPSSKNFDCKPHNSPSIPPVTLIPVKPSLLSLDDQDRQESVPYFPGESMSCPEKCTDIDENTTIKRNIPTPERMLIQKSLHNVYSKIHKLSRVQQEETSKKSPETSCLPSEKREPEGSLAKIHSANSSKIQSSERTTPEKLETVFDSPVAHNSKCPFCDGCKSKQGNESPSASMESPTDAASRPMLLRSNSQSCVSPFTRSPTFDKVRPHHPRLYRALLASGSRQPTQSSPRTTNPVSLPKLARNNQSPLLSSHPSGTNKSPKSCQTSSHCTPGSWPKKHRSTSRDDPKSSTGPPKSFRVTTLDSNKTKGRVKLFF